MLFIAVAYYNYEWFLCTSKSYLMSRNIPFTIFTRYIGNTFLSTIQCCFCILISYISICICNYIDVCVCAHAHLHPSYILYTRCMGIAVREWGENWNFSFQPGILWACMNFPYSMAICYEMRCLEFLIVNMPCSRHN